MAEEIRLLAEHTAHPLIEDLPLPEECVITCCEYWDSNLYIGSSSSEVLHFVAIPDESSSRPQFILASRLEPSPPSSDQSKGVQQIAILPQAGKACILCNGALTFHSLPELSPVGGRKVSGCSFVGGKNLNPGTSGTLDDAEVLMVCTKKRVRIVRVGDEAQVLKNIEYPECLAVARRGRFACVADSQSYSLLDVENQQMIPLFPISSVDETARPSAAKRVLTMQGEQRPERSSSLPQRGESASGKGHGRATSLGQFVGNLRIRQGAEPSPSRSSMDVPDPEAELLQGPSEVLVQEQGALPSRSITPESGPGRSSPSPAAPVARVSGMLTPHLLSPTATEFLVIVGTDPSGPAMGMFVNCDGDLARGNLSFSSYPSSIALDRGGQDPRALPLPGEKTASFVLAAMSRTIADNTEVGVEAQAWDGQSISRSWLSLSSSDGDGPIQAESVGVCAVETLLETPLTIVGDKLRAERFWVQRELQVSLEASLSSDQDRIRQEEEFGRRMGASNSRIFAWNHHSIYLLLRAPLLAQLEGNVDKITQSVPDSTEAHVKLIDLLHQIRTIEPQSEAEYFSLEYIRQKISVLLLVDLCLHAFDVPSPFREDLFLEGGADPRLVLSLVPLLRKDISQGADGIWIHAGLVHLMRERYESVNITLEADEVSGSRVDTLSLLKGYLTAWRQRKGFGSITDEKHVFASVDAALLHLLLYQDQHSEQGPGGSSSLRADIYALVDGGVDCLEHAVALLEEYGRLYVLSRLYQSRRMSAQVLATWRRILDGETDSGGEFTDGESEVRKYLTRRGNPALVEEYGVWLARRNPSLGVQVFTDEQSKVRLTPRHVVRLLETGAPDAVKVFLEHLVFEGKDVAYADDLIAYYLDSVLGTLTSNSEALTILARTYEAYRALQAPKPTYREFIAENRIDSPWWDDRLRLLELLGGTYGSAFSYDVSKVLERITPFEEALVPESIILEGRQGHHEQALHLLTHGMGDYHTAVNYCLLGGSSIFHPAVGSVESIALSDSGEHAVLFRHLLHEFLRIEDAQLRVEQTGNLLARFGSWFDLNHVLESIPSEWPVGSVATFLCAAMRRIRQQRNEVIVTKALRGLQSTKTSYDFAEKCRELGPKVVPAMQTPPSLPPSLP